MAPNDTDVNRTGTRPGTMSGYHPRSSGNYVPYILGAAVLVAILYMFFGDNISNQTTLPTETIVPQTTTTPAPAPATK